MYATPRKLSKAKNSLDSNSNKNDDFKQDLSTRGDLRAVLNINPELKEKFNKIKQISE